MRGKLATVIFVATTYFVMETTVKVAYNLGKYAAFKECQKEINDILKDKVKDSAE